MFVFALDGALFKFRAKTPDLTPLFQLPPRIAARYGCDPIAHAGRPAAYASRQADDLLHRAALTSDRSDDVRVD